MERLLLRCMNDMEGPRLGENDADCRCTSHVEPYFQVNPIHVPFDPNGPTPLSRGKTLSELVKQLRTASPTKHVATIGGVSGNHRGTLLLQ